MSDQAKERVFAELRELSGRITKARAFRESQYGTPEHALWLALSPMARDLLHLQINAMATYQAALILRLEWWDR